jgi:membrane-bound lytic murein transglycosylase D
MAALARLLLLGVLVIAGELAAASVLDRPKGLERDVEFWRRVFTEITTGEGFVHDDQRLDVVYEIVRLPDRHANVERRRVSLEATEKYATLLRDLAAGKRTGSADEQRVLAIWGDDADRATLEAASGRVRFQLGQSDRFREGLVRSGRWERYIERTLLDSGLPPELIALPHVESAYEPTARSHVGALGLWQFMPETGRRYMRVDAVVDERLDPFRASEAAARLLTDNFQVTGSWPTAITAYNHGAAGMRRAIEQTGTRDIETLVRTYRGRAFGFASRNFYVSFLAAADVRRDAERYFGKLERAVPDEPATLELPGYLSVDALEDVLRIDRATLARFNPSLRPPVWQGSKYVPRGHRLYAPARPGIDPVELLSRVPASRWAHAQIADTYHVVQRGETLSAIAPRYGARVDDLVALNGLRSAHSIRAGQRLVLPAGGGARARPVVAAGTALPPVPEVPVRMVTDAGRHADAAPAVTIDMDILSDSAAAVYAVGPDGLIRVHEGESLDLYARWASLGIDTLRRHNEVRQGGVIRVGSTLKVPFTAVDRETFESRRIAHHREVRARFLARHRIEGTHEHRVRPGESAWFIAERRYRIPVWLVREFNPDLDLAAVHPGTRIVIPRVVRISG